MQTKLKTLTLLTLLTLTLTPLTSACTNQTNQETTPQTTQTHDEQDTTPPEVLWDGPELTKPTTWNQINPQAAADAVEYFLQSWYWGLAHKDISIFKAMSGPECRACQHLINTTEACLAADDSWFRTYPPEFEVDKIKTFPNDPYAFVLTGNYKVLPGEYYCPDEGLSKNPTENERLTFIVVNSPEGEWYIEGYSGDYEKDE